MNDNESTGSQSDIVAVGINMKTVYCEIIKIETEIEIGTEIEIRMITDMVHMEWVVVE